MHPFVIDADGHLYVHVATATNSCQFRIARRSPGIDPCEELKTRGGIWRFDAERPARYSFTRRALRHRHPQCRGHSLDDSRPECAHTARARPAAPNWPELYKPEEEATLPAEELIRIWRGWRLRLAGMLFRCHPGQLVLAPEYGGDGGKAVGVCAQKLAPVAAFPAHWAPNDVVFTPARVSAALSRWRVHRLSWLMGPRAVPAKGYNVVFQPLVGRAAGAAARVFADGFAGRSRIRKAEPPALGCCGGPRWRAVYLGRHRAGASIASPIAAAVTAKRPASRPVPRRMHRQARREMRARRRPKVCTRTPAAPRRSCRCHADHRARCWFLENRCSKDAQAVPPARAVTEKTPPARHGVRI